MEDTLETASKIISEWQSNDVASDHISPNTSLFDHHSRSEFLQFIRAIKDLQASLLYLSSSSSSSSSSPSPSQADSKKLSTGYALLRSAIKRLAKEFSALLKANKPDLNSPPQNPIISDTNIAFASSLDLSVSQEYDSDPATYPNPNPMDDLKLIADCMLGAGYGKKCIKIYKLTRRSIIEDTASKLGAKKLKKSQVEKMDIETIDTKIKDWCNGVKPAVKNLYLGEKILCDHLFSSSYSVPPVKDSCFAEVCKDSALLLFRAPGKLSKHSKRSPERVFRHLDLYEPLSDLSPYIDLIFSSDLTTPVRSQAEVSMTRVVEATRLALSDFELVNQNHKDSGKSLPAPGGGVHPLTRYVMNYLLNLVNYTNSLDKILADCPVSLQLPESYFEGEVLLSPTALRFKWFILVLLGRLDIKSELYRDASLSYLFLANNVQYVVCKVKMSSLRSVLGEKWVEKHEEKVAQHVGNHERNGWDRVIASLPEDPRAEISLKKVRECFKKFNREFTEEYRKQVDWVVVDEKLREEMKECATRKVIKRYGCIYDEYKQVLGKSRDRGAVESVVKFTPQDLESFLSELLDGSDNSSNDSLLWPPPTHLIQVVPAAAEQSRRKRLLNHIRQHLHHQ